MVANNNPSQNFAHPLLEPDREQLRIFVEAIFHHSGDKGFASLRAFIEGTSDEKFRITPTGLSGGLDHLIEAAEDDARRAAQNPRPVVFCPPLAVFSNNRQAREVDVALGLVISVECDQHPKQARAKLEAILGPATVVIKSGGRWTNGSDVAEDKLHLHWVLAAPAAEAESRDKLRQARDLATRLVGGDASGAPLGHCYRWPGSWHRKGEPRMCVIENVTDNEIDLDSALQKLKAAVPDADLPPPRLSCANDNDDNRADGGLNDPALVPAFTRLVRTAVRAIPNDYPFDKPSRQEWINLGIAIKFALYDSKDGLAIYREWSQRSPKYDLEDNTDKAWNSFKCRGDLGYRHLDRLASMENPGWDVELFPSTVQSASSNQQQANDPPQPNAAHWSTVISRINIS
jgi:hypothetical protein